MVLGTRPEAIKLAPVARALNAAGLSLRIIHTGQHPAADWQRDLFGGLPIHSLGEQPCGDPFSYVGRVAARLRHRSERRPALVMVQGDTASAYAGARYAVHGALPLAHVEAGLRSFDRRNPWPEEDFRIAIDRASALLFAPTPLAAAHLRAERLGGIVHVTGNSGIDTLLETLDTLPPVRRPKPWAWREGPILVTCHRREHWGEPLDHVMGALRRLAVDHGRHIQVVMHPNPEVQRRWRACLGDQQRIRLLGPLEHRTMLIAMRAADLILSDSGGMQEEAPYLRTPLFILRQATERPEGIATGNLKLVGTDADAIVAAVEHFYASPIARFTMRRRAAPYGRGDTGQRIAAITADWLRTRRTPHTIANDRTTSNILSRGWRALRASS